MIKILKELMERVVNLWKYHTFLPDVTINFDEKSDTLIVKNGFCNTKILDKWAKQNNMESKFMTSPDGAFHFSGNLTIGEANYKV